MYEITNKVILVTGGATGIGAVLVRAFLDQGAKHVAILDLNVDAGQVLEKELGDKYGANKVKFYKCDVTGEELDSSYDAVLKGFGYIDVVVNNAGIMNDSPGVYAKEIAVNVTALVTSSLKAYNLMRKDQGGKGGTIINIASVVALCQFALVPIYSATKTAVLQFSNCLGSEVHFSRSGVRVLAMCLGATDTALLTRSKVAAFDREHDELFIETIQKQMQRPQSAVQGIIEAYKKGESGSTWVVANDKPVQDISSYVNEAYEILSQGYVNLL